MIEPLVVEFEVSAPIAHAFDVWTQRCATWWPPTHTITGNPAAITFEPSPGGRIYETAPDGSEHPWGRILDWDPPTRLRFSWHLFFTPAEATEVDITFHPHANGTVVRLEQTGWDKLGPAGPPRRERTHTAWSTITTRFAVSVGS